MTVSRQLTIADIMTRVFPTGTSAEPVDSGDAYAKAPDFPPDLFAIAALLLQTGGAYHYLVPSGKKTDWPSSSVCIDPADLAAWRDAGSEWRNSYPKTPAVVDGLWSTLRASAGEHVFREPEHKASPPEWWLVAYALMIIADEASADSGYPSATIHSDPRSNDVNWVAVAVNANLHESDEARLPADNHRRVYRQIASITMRVDRDVVCVQPKSHTPEVGCTPRTLVHNLSLLPPRGAMRAHWQRPPQDLLPESKTDLRLLLIPFPYVTKDTWFSGEEVLDEAQARASGAKPWGWFELRQRWLKGPEMVIQLVETLLKKAQASDLINGIVFPEYALDWATYKELADHLRDKHPEIEFLVSGSSDNCASEKGNFALSSHFYPEDRDGKPVRMVSTSSRAKHHRWRIEGSQSDSYVLNDALDRKFVWWEKIPLPQREIHVNVFRKASVFTTMICEDLARSDPAHEVLKALGPNLVFVLLMDGPQLNYRWSARYANGLSDDPGSSVLTLTSRGLMARANERIAAMPPVDRGSLSANWTVGLWKDANSAAYPIECQPGAHAVVLTLKGTPTTESTLDGRDSQTAVAWERRGECRQISLDPLHDAALLALVEKP
jgi:hypothetical protein